MRSLKGLITLILVSSFSFLSEQRAAKTIEKSWNFNFILGNSLFKMLEYSDILLKPSIKILNDCLEV